MIIKKILRKFIPKRVLSLRHWYHAWSGARKYGHPSDELLVIGITGTSGKSSTIAILRHLLQAAGYTVGSLSTVDFCVAGVKQWNDQKMTMLGRRRIQQFLRKMVAAGCDVVLLETTSEGFLQFRHRFINYDMMVLTNLYSEHIEAHGSFENYKKAKLGIFRHVAKSKRKTLRGKIMPKVSVVNGDSSHADEFLDIPFDRRVVYVRNDEEFFVESSRLKDGLSVVIGKNVRVDRDGVYFDVDEVSCHAALYGEHAVSNILAAIAVCRFMNIGMEEIKRGVRSLHPVPGRIEFIKEAEREGFQIIVDYAFEPVAMQQLYSVVKIFEPKKIIHVFGSTGGGRDMARRFTVGEYVGTHADIVFVTDEDPYDDDPLRIMADVAGAVERAGKIRERDLFLVLSREEAIHRAINLAKKGDMVLITGKGSEQAMVVKGVLRPSDDRLIARAALEKIALKN